VRCGDPFVASVASPKCLHGYYVRFLTVAVQCRPLAADRTAA
jgi:hypothetical protein